MNTRSSLYRSKTSTLLAPPKTRAHTWSAARRTIAALVLVGTSLGAMPIAHAAGVAPGAATAVQREQAQSRFLKGKDKFTKKDYEGAITEFNASLDIIASPNTRLYLGRSLREAGRILEAYVELGRTEVEAKELARDDPRYDKAAQSAHEERMKIEPKLAFLNIDVAHAEAATTLKVGADEIRRGGWSEPIPVMPGSAQVTAQTPGRAPVQRSVNVVAGERASVSIDVAEGAASNEPPPKEAAPVVVTTSSREGLRSFAYVAGGAAVVGLGLFTVFGIKANGTYSDLESACNGGPCPPGHEADISRGRTEQTVANVGLGVFAVGTIAAVTLWVLSSPKSAEPKTGAAPKTTARLLAGPSFVGLQGGF